MGPMTLDALIHQTGEWLKGVGQYAEIVISSRIRLARNLSDLPFPHWAKRAHRAQVRDRILRAVDRCRFLRNALILPIDDLSELDRTFLLERRLISRDLATGHDEKAVVIGDREMVSLMINEEDHLRLQVLVSGFQLDEAWSVMQQVNEELEMQLTYAFRPDWGYLTTCPTNVGTGMRTSCMLHLPCLVMAKQIYRVLHALIKLGLTARGLYGEGTEATGNFFQLSNQVALGVSEEEILDNLQRLIRQVVAQEEAARRAILGQSRQALEDRIWRAYGTLKNAHLISSEETVNLLSMVRLGVDLGLLPHLKREQVNRLFIQIQPAHLQKLEGRLLTPSERDGRRAALIRQAL